MKLASDDIDLNNQNIWGGSYFTPIGTGTYTLYTEETFYK